ncbi:MAG: hypothetical protein EOM64_05990 [Erysipelotrichia bacterium]|nr:hypothetical protein [Erysipelotrichia bacterium]
MKRIMKAVLASGVAMCAAVTPVLAEQNEVRNNGICQYADQNGDGICDNCGNGTRTGYHSQRNQNGLRKADGTGNPSGKHLYNNNYCGK